MSLIPGLVNDNVEEILKYIEDKRFLRINHAWDKFITMRIISIIMKKSAPVNALWIFPNMKSLDCGYNRSDISVLTKLTSLDCDYNESDISHMTNLTSLICNRNESDISGLIGLTSLICYDNESDIF